MYARKIVAYIYLCKIIISNNYSVHLNNIIVYGLHCSTINHTTRVHVYYPMQTNVYKD